MKPSRRAGTGLAKQAGGNSHAAGPVPVWKPHLSQYPDQRILTFASKKDRDAAIDLLWSDELHGLPHETPDGKAIVVPAESVEYFARAGVRFTEKRLRAIGELSPEEIRRLRG
jgi:hypothetical protein